MYGVFLVVFAGAPNNCFLMNAVKRYFVLSGVLLKLYGLILDCAKIICSVILGKLDYSRNLLGLLCPFPENLMT